MSEAEICKKELQKNIQGTTYINYFDKIDQNRIQAMMGICSDLVLRKGKKILYFLLSSPGGQVNAGITFYNFLRALPAEIVMHNIGSIDSIATVIFLAADKRYSASHSNFLLHGVSLGFTQKTELNLTQIEEKRSQLEKDQNKIAGIIMERTRIGKDEINKLFRQGETKDLEFAKSKGIIHDILEPKIPKGADLLSVKFSENR